MSRFPKFDNAAEALADRLVVKALTLASHMTGAQQLYVGSFYQGKEALREPWDRAYAHKGE